MFRENAKPKDVIRREFLTRSEVELICRKHLEERNLIPKDAKTRIWMETLSNSAATAQKLGIQDPTENT